MSGQALIETKNLYLRFVQGRFSGNTVVHALKNVSLSIFPGETLGIVGETGSGKSSFCRTVMRLYRPNEGSILFKGREIAQLPERRLGDFRSKVQMIFQDPVDSLNPRLTVGAIIEEPLIIQTRLGSGERTERVATLLEDVGLSRSVASRYPHEFSGGQRQRIAIARALALKPELIVCDEPVSALDVSVQSQILNLLLDLQAEYKLSLIFVSHDLAIVRHMSDRVAVMYGGEVVELADSETIYRNPRHEYTRTLLSSIPGRARRLEEAAAGGTRVPPLNHSAA